MADIINRIQERQRLDDDARVAQAEHNANWSESFERVPPTDELRRNMNLADTIERTINNRMALDSAYSEKAMRLKLGQQRFEQNARLQPLKERKLEKETELVGSHEAFMQQKDADAIQDSTNFLKAVAAIKHRPGTPEYREAVGVALHDNPRVVTTKAGSEIIDRLFKEDKEIADITIPERLVPTGATQSKSGVSIHYGEPKTTPQDDDSQKRLTHLESLLARSKMDPDVATYLKDEIRKIRPPSAEELKMDEIKLRKEHDVLEAGLKGLKGDQLATQVAALNQIKAKLGFKTLTPEGKVIEPTAPVGTPTVIPVPVGMTESTLRRDIPAATPAPSKFEFKDGASLKNAYKDIPDGSEFTFQGKKYVKPKTRQ